MGIQTDTERDTAKGTAGAEVGALLRVAFPLILSTGGYAVKLFTDRLMLTWYSREAVSASMPAGLTVFMFETLILGTAGYAQVFVAQYIGARRPERAGAAVWQGVHVALAGGVLLSTGALWGESFFRLVGHAPAVQRQEVVYFGILAGFAGFSLVSSALCAFWGGAGRTSVVMTVTLATAALNILLNWILIFGHCGSPPLGIAGSALGTAISEGVACLIYLILFLRRDNRERFGTWPARALDGELMRRLLRFGFPNGLHFLLDIGAFNLFVLLMGRIQAGAEKGDFQEASNIVFGINTLTFLPAMGIGQAAGILVGQAVGAKDILAARRVVRKARGVVLLFMGVTAALLVLCPGPILASFTRPNDPGQAATLALSRVLLRFAAAWMLFDGMWIVHLHAVKAAGDTHYTMWMGVALAWFGLAMPTCAAFWLGASIWTFWTILVVYVWVGACVFYLRYRSGHWESMRVIEEAPPRLDPEPADSENVAPVPLA